MDSVLTEPIGKIRCGSFLFAFLIILSLTCATRINVKKCPVTETVWKARSQMFECKTGRVYHCIQDEIGKLIETCMIPYHLRPMHEDGCPLASLDADEESVLGGSFHTCQGNGCPQKNDSTYWTNELYKYPKCVQHNDVITEDKQSTISVLDVTQNTTSIFVNETDVKVVDFVLAGVVAGVVAALIIFIILVTIVRRAAHHIHDSSDPATCSDMERKNPLNNAEWVRRATMCNHALMVRVESANKLDLTSCTSLSCNWKVPTATQVVPIRIKDHNVRTSRHGQVDHIAFLDPSNSVLYEYEESPQKVEVCPLEMVLKLRACEAYILI